MTRRRVSNPLALAVLSCLTERPMHPYEISTTLRHRGKEQSIKLNYGSLYSVVEKLQKHGLIEPKETVREGKRPERTVYQITPAGIEEHEDWLAELLSTPAREYTSLEAGLSLMGGLPPDETARLLQERVGKLRMDSRTTAAMLDVAREQAVPEVFLIEGVYHQAMVDAEVTFVSNLVEQIRSNTLGGSRVWRRIHELRASGMTYEEIFSDPVGNLGEEARGMGPTPDDS